MTVGGVKRERGGRGGGGGSYIRIKPKFLVWQSVCKVRALRYQKDIKGQFLNAESVELFINLSSITLYNDSEMKEKMRGGESEEERGIKEKGACGLGIAGVCRALVSPEGITERSPPPPPPLLPSVFCSLVEEGERKPATAKHRGDIGL